MIIAQGYSKLATAILKSYYRDLIKHKDIAPMNDDWFDDLLTLATRFSELNVKKLKEVHNEAKRNRKVIKRKN